MDEYIIEMRNIVKDFPGIRANDNVTLLLKKGEIHALLGENGAGKSTLMSVLFGLYQPDGGQILMNGKPVRIDNPNDANRLGIGMVHQHFKLVHNFTALQNIILGVETVSHGVLKMDEARKKVMALSDRYGLRIDPDAKIEETTVGMQQRVEILKMLYRDNEILIFDEPTAVLTPQEITELMSIMRNLTNEGKSILFITHKLNEIKELADRCTVLRKGKGIGTVQVSDVSKEALSEMMVGRKVNFSVEKEKAQPGNVVLAVSHLTVKAKHHTKPLVNDVSFTVRKGEIVCVAGIDGNGQSELIYALTGLMTPDAGEIKLNGRDITRASVRERNNLHISHIPEDRHKYGLVLDYNLAQNLVLKSYLAPDYQKHGFIRFDKVHENAEHLIEQFDIRSGQGAQTPARAMSGGNQQKAIVAREISLAPELLIAVQPTRGLDVGAIEYIHRQLVVARDRGCAVLLVSLELDEVQSLSDRIYIIYEGAFVADIASQNIDIREIGLYMAGSKGGQAT
ncbi:MAG: ABC transporter ATP-binding protein [Clostridia bacterium]